MRVKLSHSIKLIFLSSVAVVTLSLASSPAHAKDRANFDIDGQSLASALNEFGLQSDENIIFSPDIVSGKRAKPLKGMHDVNDALRILLNGTGLNYSVTSNGTYVIRPNTVATPPKSGDKKSTTRDQGTARLSEMIVVVGSRNTDIQRLEADPLPYKVVDKKQIETSNASNISQLLGLNLSSNSSTTGSNTSGVGNTSSITLRGLSERETLILVDGRRLPDQRQGSALIGQADINGIPLSAIERIEVLPSSAAGIYGGNATGGVINIILKRDYNGIEIGISHDTTSRFDFSETRFDVNGGIDLGVNTKLTFAGSYQTGTELAAIERDFFRDGRVTAAANDPNSFAFTPLGATPNIQSAAGFVFDPVLGFIFAPAQALTLNGGAVELGSTFTSIPAGFNGIAADGTGPLVANAGIFNLDPANSAQLPGGQAGNLRTSPRVISVLGAINHEFSDKLSGFVEGSYLRNRARNIGSGVALFPVFLSAFSPANPFDQDITVSIPLASPGETGTITSSTVRLGGGLTYQIVPNDWFISADITWNRNTSTSTGFTSFNDISFGSAINDGTINPFVDTVANPIGISSFLASAPDRFSPERSTLLNISLRSGGTLPIKLPGGDVTFNTAAEYRNEKLSATRTENRFFDFDFDPITFADIGVETATTTFLPEQSQNIYSIFGEFLFPIVGRENDIPLLHSLQLQVAGRFDHYDVDAALSSTDLDANGDPVDPITRIPATFSEVNPTVAIRYQPTEDIVIRGSYSQGFLPPALVQFAPRPAPTIPNFFFPSIGLTDPLRGDELIGNTLPVFVQEGGSPSLNPEQSKTFSAGVIYTPNWVPGLNITVDWTRTKITNSISPFLVFDPQQLQLLLSTFPERVTRAAPDAGDPFSVGPITGLDATLANFSSRTVSAIDYSVKYNRDIEGFGNISLRADFTRNLKNESQATPDSPPQRFLDTANVVKHRGSASIGWSNNGLSAQWAAQYVGSYSLDNLAFTIPAQGSGRVNAQTYHDLLLSYDFGDSPKFGGNALSNVKIDLAVINIFDKRPPFDASNFTTFASPFGDVRLRRFRLSIKKSF